MDKYLLAHRRGLLRSSRRNGFTLIELLVVVVILGILVAIVVRNVQGRVHKARVVAVKAQMREFESSLDTYKLDNHQYPASEQGLEALAKKPTTGHVPANYPEGGYIKYVPKDPWGNDYIYTFRPGAENPIEIASLGRDGNEGGEGEDKDLINYQILRE